MTSDPTARMVAKLERVLLVHDKARELTNVYDALRKAFVLRTATSATEVVELVRTLPLACVVCIPGGSIRARDVQDAVASASQQQAPRIVFLRGEGSTDLDAVFFLTTGKTWLPMDVLPEELVRAVRAASTS